MPAQQQQRDLFTRNWRVTRPPGASEFQLQKSLVERLQWQCRDGVLFFHCPNGEERDKRVAAKLKAMGVRPGVADLIFIWPELVACPNLMIFPRVLFLELKRRGKRQSPVQIDFEQHSKVAGCFYEMTDNIDDAVAILQRFAILPPERERDDNNNNNTTRASPSAYRTTKQVLSTRAKAHYSAKSRAP